MTETASKPIIFLAFANDRQADGTYLRNLGQEAERLRDVLADAEKAGLGQIEIRTSVSAESILKLFIDSAYKGRIAIFHYAGHAEDYELLLESVTGERALADGRGLAAFLRHQHGLQLVFLNACSTQAQVAGLLDAGVSAVVATSRAIDDQIATDFARHFYTALASGDSIGLAFEKAQAALHFVRGDLTRHLRPVQDAHTEHSAAGWPWALYQRKGAEEVATWNLPGAANNPLFGLDLPAMDLPETPYPEKLQWYDASYAPVFFGRGQDIRVLYNRVTADGGDPIILFYGQSGVGKSSLLAAGLMPRLAVQRHVVYLRRNQNKGLLGTLLAALDLPNETPPTEANVLALWHTQETMLGKPLVILLDQVEEIYTRGESAQANEMADFLTALRTLFLDPAQRPQGKLILGFRKEWLAEIDKQLADAHLPRTAVFLRRMDRQGVVEAILGPTSTPRLRQKYGLQVEKGLADEIARDLVKDTAAAVSPTLQILLAKLWGEAKQVNRTQPHYDSALYERLRNEGYRLDDFLDQQMKELEAEHAAAVTSGLALDLLAFHTSEHGAEERTLQSLHDTYQHVQQTVDQLLQSFQRRYLLVDPAPDQENPERPTRLVHDALAPVVRKKADLSELPGQVASRVLENRVREWRNQSEVPYLDEWSLQRILAGKSGMRAWASDERRLIELSQTALDQQKPPRLEESIFPPSLKVRHFAQGAILEVYVITGARDTFSALFACGVWSILGFMCPVALVISLVNALISALVSSPSLINLSQYAMVFSAFIGASSIGIYMARRVMRPYLRFDFFKQEARLRPYPLFSSAQRSHHNTGPSHVHLNVRRGNNTDEWIGELTCRDKTFVMTKPRQSKQEAIEELALFYRAINHALGLIVVDPLQKDRMGNFIVLDQQGLLRSR